MFAKHLRVSCIGVLGPAAQNREQFAYGLCMTATTQDPLIPWVIDSAGLNDIASDMATFHAAPGSRISSQAILQEVKIAFIGPDGKYTQEPSVWPTGDVPGGVGHDGHILPQSALAVSWVTARRGPTGKGRMYLPMPVVSPDPAAGFLVSVGDAESIRHSCHDLLVNLRNYPGIDVINPVPVVASSKGYNTPITGVRVGRVVDTIRTRRRALKENYTATENVV